MHWIQNLDNYFEKEIFYIYLTYMFYIIYLDIALKIVYSYFAGSESDSTEEPVVGNVNKFAVVPPNYSGKPKKGHLIFDACFESGKRKEIKFVVERLQHRFMLDQNLFTFVLI